MKFSSPPLGHVRHSLAHLLAMAVLKQFPGAKLGIGPVIEHGFYYDFLLEKDAEIDLKEAQNEMRRLIKRRVGFKGKKVSLREAKKLFRDQPFKRELIEEFAKEGKELSVYQTDGFIDLCKGGHVEHAGQVNPEAFALTHKAGAYWRGSEKNPMLTRVYGIAFETKQELDNYLHVLEEGKKRDHKKLGSQLELFMFHETAPGMPYWLPKGLIVLNELIAFWRREHTARGYQEIKSPLINKKELYVTSGHWEHYRDDMFVAETAEAEIYALKPMNCPNAMIVFGSKRHSYRDLPLRLSDTDTLHRYERSGTLNGLLRVREFSQDDAHIFVTEDQIQEEYQSIFELTDRFYSIFGIEYSFSLGTRPKKFMGEPKSWAKAEQALTEIIEKSGKSYVISEGDGAFYGPKIDIRMKDSLGREWQMGTIQLDFQIPRRFNLAYIDANGKSKTPVVIHRVIYGSLERFMGILIEHLAGSFPFWLAPVQVRILTINEDVIDYTKTVEQQLQKNAIRVEIDARNESLNKKIREGETQKIPYLFIVGKQEKQKQMVNIRSRDKGVLGGKTIQEFVVLCEKN